MGGIISDEAKLAITLWSFEPPYGLQSLGNAWGATRIQRELKRAYGEQVSRPTVGSVLVGPT